MKNVLLVLLITAGYMNAENLSDNKMAFFENNVRPLLDKHCYKCHSEKSKKIKGKLLLDSKAGWMKGGDSGEAVIIPGKTAESLLFKMVNHLPEVEAMPPKYKLKQEEIKTLETWIKNGAADPRNKALADKLRKDDFNLDERKKWWSLQPVKNVTPPQVKDHAWVKTDIDRFIIQKLEAKDWKPAPETNKRTLIRRVTFDLTGLPPTQKEINDFLSDNSDKAYEKVVDRLLSSPHFGEKWARHWMDVVRYAETKAFEADYTMPHVYQYRDYLIRAYNQDVPYNRFILESLAGDLIPPRYNPENGNNEALSGTGYIYLTDGQHGPPDIHGDEARIFDGMIDVISKAFTGITVACAKCHDHKFDAITTKDYYSMYGMISSSRFHHANIASPKKQLEIRRKLQNMEPLLVKEYAAALRGHIKKLPAYLRVFRSETVEKSKNIKDLLAREKLNPAVYGNIKKALSAKASFKKFPQLKTLADFIKANSTKSFKFVQEPLKSYYGLTAESLGQLKVNGNGFDSKPVSGTAFAVSGNQFLKSIIGRAPAAGRLSGRFGGSIRTPDFILDGSNVTVSVKGRNASVHLIVRHYELVGKGPTTNRLRININSDTWTNVTFKTNLWKNEKAYIEVIQHGASLDVTRNSQYSYRHNEESYVALKGFPVNYMSTFAGLASGKSHDNPGLVSEFALNLVNAWEKGTLNSSQADALTVLFQAGILPNQTNLTASIKRKTDIFRKTALSVPMPVYTRSLVEGTAADEPVYVRGNHKSLSKDPNPRHFLHGVFGEPFKTEGSGRLEWAEKAIREDNPLTSRVMVNRLWHHIFGRGIVQSVNNFGKLGRKPTHPELLDWLAKDFITNGWSVKKSLRKMVLSSVYRTSSVPGPNVVVEDPENELLQHMSVRRMTAETIRDNILATTGSLNPQLYGPSVAANVNGLPNSRAKPRKSGPVDGNGRRSVYMEIRRNFLPPFLRAFDLPNATESIGKRNVTNVPAQSLALMNDEFVQLQTTRWGKAMASGSTSFKDKVNMMHLKALGRPATAEEFAWADTAFKELAAVKRTNVNDPDLWREFCHIMLNRKEFIYIF